MVLFPIGCQKAPLIRGCLNKDVKEGDSLGNSHTPGLKFWGETDTLSRATEFPTMLVWFALLGFISILFFLLCSLGRGGLTPRLDLWVILAIFCLLGSAKRRPQKIGVQDGRSGILMLQLSQL